MIVIRGVSFSDTSFYLYHLQFLKSPVKKRAEYPGVANYKLGLKKYTLVQQSFMSTPVIRDKHTKK